MSRKLATLLVGPNSMQQAKPFLMYETDVRKISIDLASYCGGKATTISSAEWTSDNGITLSSDVVTGYVVSAFLSAQRDGTFRGKTSIALANGENKVFLWRVVVIPSKPAIFPPACPILQQPEDEAVSQTEVTLIWGEIPGATQYTVYLDGEVIATTTEPTYDLTGLTPSTGYEWTVTATVEGLESNGCGSFTFTTAPVGCPLLLTPAQGASTATTITLTWGDIALSEEYRVYLWPTSESMPGTPTATVDSATFAYEATGLDYSTSYSWTVHSVISGVESSGCAIQNFTTQSEPFDGVLADRATNFFTSFVEQAVQWDNDVYDLANWHDATNLDTTQRVRFTVPSGVSLIRSAVQHDSFFVPEIRFGKNGSDAPDGSAGATCGTSHDIAAVSAILAVTPGDYIYSKTFVDLEVNTKCWQAVEAIPAGTRYALLKRDSTSSWTAGSDTVISWDTEVADVGGWHSATNPTRCTVPAGVTLAKVSMGVDFGDNVANYPIKVYIDVRKNGASVAGGFARLQERGSEILLTASTPPLEVTAGDYFEVRANIANTVNLNASGYTWMCIEECPVEQKGALVTKSVSQTVNGGPTAIAWGAETYDASSIHSNVTNNTRLTVPAGVNYARPSFCIGVGATGSQLAQVYKNGVGYNGMPADSCTSAYTERLWSPGCWIPVVEGDYFELMLTTGGSVDIVVSDYNWFALEVRT